MHVMKRGASRSQFAQKVAFCGQDLRKSKKDPVKQFRQAFPNLAKIAGIQQPHPAPCNFIRVDLGEGAP